GHRPLAADGVPGAKTVAALEEAEKRRADGKPDISDHFSAREFWCKCMGKYSGCNRIMSPRILVLGAEKYRTIAGPYSPLSVYRCDEHNAKTPNAYEFSAHRRGLAFDVVARFSWQKVQALGFAPAIGHGSDGLVRHVDWRHLDSFVNRPKITGSVTNPYKYNTYG
ncbi:MAG: hypothetical protein LC687_05330, partial [Actinobacteria bacterium]|nr:hypothetical protein [Actinomycetota bacterium]MCA1807252.1 hypothetical protein [Actinomycetota bacterium]